MSVITYEGVDVVSQQGVSVLESLEAEGFRIPFSCRSGVCQSCLLQTKDAVPSESQAGLRDQQIMQGYFLSCSCYPKNDLLVNAKQRSDLITARVVDKKILNETLVIRGDLNGGETGDVENIQPSTMIVALFIEVDFTWFAGQYINVWFDEHTARPYSIANRCDDKKVMELHVKRHALGEVSRWLCNDLSIGGSIQVSQPMGDCFYTDSYQSSPLLLVATGTGLAPLYGVLQEALYRQHTKAIHLYVAAREPKNLYYQQELQCLARQFENIVIHTVVKQHAEKGQLEGDVVDVVKKEHVAMNGYKIFLCGSPAMVKTLQRACFFQGAALSDILTDAFEMAAK
ncbi:MAG: NAD(P)H-flavin reductase/ferredoxin [Candidatus Endobugula sp.]|jgi:NAD(P)H-flavin reductase/ferredoxin